MHRGSPLLAAALQRLHLHIKSSAVADNDVLQCLTVESGLYGAEEHPLQPAQLQNVPLDTSNTCCFRCSTFCLSPFHYLGVYQHCGLRLHSSRPPSSVLHRHSPMTTGLGLYLRTIFYSGNSSRVVSRSNQTFGQARSCILHAPSASDAGRCCCFA